MGDEMGRIRELLKSSGDLICSLLGIDRFKESEDGKKLINEAKKTGNALTSALGHGSVFQTNEMKEKAEQDAKQMERDNIAAMAKNSGQIVDLLNQLNGKL